MIIHPDDNVEVNIENGHKYAIRPIPKGSIVIKYGYPIGYATENIDMGAWVHEHNMATTLTDRPSYRYEPNTRSVPFHDSEITFTGYKRSTGEVGIRNEVWIIVTVGCVNKIAERIAKQTGVFAYTHPFGCSQLGNDHKVTQKILCGLVNHPNCAAVLVLGLGCENNNISEFKKVLGNYDPQRVKFLNCQDVDDEIEEGIRIVEELKRYANTFQPTQIPICKLRVGLKCGGSDGYSGITANPLVGRFCDRLTSLGGSCIMTEVPEMFGAEQLLMQRCKNRNVFNKTVKLINDFKDYYKRNHQPIYENPSPGNKEGGITTLEEKSLGCVQKGGCAVITDVLDYGSVATEPGLSLLNGPGNDLVAITNLTAAGAHLILFTTGRGTPLGAPVPTVKIASNPYLASLKKNWIDFDASLVLNGVNLDDAFFSFILDITAGKQTKNEIHNYRDISIFKDGVTL